MRTIYLDTAATTPALKSVVEEMLPYFSEEFANPSGSYDFSKTARQAIELSRRRIASLTGAAPEEIFFTSGGSEADNWAIKGAADFFEKNRRKIVTTPIEHHAVLNTAAFLKNHGFTVEYLPVDKFGVVDLEAAENIIDSDTAVVSVMFANNEVGTIQPIEEISKTAHKHGALFHTDAVQAAGHVKIDVSEMGIDMLSASGHKFGAPKGIGFLYKKNGVEISSLIHGGSQEGGLRAGTENVPYIAAIGKAAEEAEKNMAAENIEIAGKRDCFVEMVLKGIAGSVLNGHPEKRLPSNANISFRGVEGKSVVSMLSMYGICVSAQSACASKSDSVSHVLSAMGLDFERARGAVRFTFGSGVRFEDLDYTVNCLERIIKNLRCLDS